MIRHPPNALFSESQLRPPGCFITKKTHPCFGPAEPKLEPSHNRINTLLRNYTNITIKILVAVSGIHEHKMNMILILQNGGDFK
jgi:hypothetical protein